MATSLDARGLTCPAPVLLVKDAVEQQQPASLTVLVDNQASSENVTRFLQTRGYAVSENIDGTDYTLTAARQGEAATPDPITQASPSQERVEKRKILVLVTASTMGSGDDELGAKLMVNYLKTIKELGEDLWQLVFINGGVKLTIDASPVLEDIKAYEQAGTIVLACGTCLEHFGLTSRKQVGTTTNMLDIVTATQLADKVITVG